MRILQVNPHFSPAFGGLYFCTYYTSRELVSRGHEVTVYASNLLDQKRKLNNRTFEMEKEGIRIVYFNTSYVCCNLKITPDLIFQALNEVEHFDLIHMQGYRTFQNMIAYQASRKFDVPYVLQAHGSLPRIIGKQRLKWIYDAFFGHRLLRDASKVIALTRMEAEQYKGMGVLQEKIKVIPNGIDLSEYVDLPPKGEFKKKLGIDHDEKIVLYVGRIHESKGLDLLLEAFNIVTKELENVRLVVVGPDDGYTTTLSRLISASGIEERVVLTGFVKKRDKLAALVDSDIFVTPHFYGFPFTFLEACLAGCPIITTTHALDWIHNKVGYVVNKSPIALAEGIYTILQEGELQRRFRNNCTRAVKNFNISTVTHQLMDTYRNMTNRTVA